MSRCKGRDSAELQKLLFKYRFGRLRGGRQGEIKQALVFERHVLCPAGTRAFLYFGLGRLRGGRQMGAC